MSSFILIYLETLLYFLSSNREVSKVTRMDASQPATKIIFLGIKVLPDGHKTHFVLKGLIIVLKMLNDCSFTAVILSHLSVSYPDVEGTL